VHHFPFHIGDYLAATSHLSNDEDLAFRRILDMYYHTELPIPLDTKWVAKRLRVTVESIQSVLQDLFTKHDDGYHHKRCDQEIAKYKSFTVSGKKGAAVRWGNETGREAIGGLSGGYGVPIGSLSNPNGNREPRTENLKTSKASTSDASRPTPARKKVSLPSDFAVSPRVSAWATEKGYDRLADHLDAFRRKAEMNAYRYVDWDLAFMEAIREDWAKLRGNGRSGPAPIAVPDGTIKCETCGTRTRQFTGRQCDPCWRGVVNPRAAA